MKMFVIFTGSFYVVNGLFVYLGLVIIFFLFLWLLGYFRFKQKTYNLVAFHCNWSLNIHSLLSNCVSDCIPLLDVTTRKPGRLAKYWWSSHMLNWAIYPQVRIAQSDCISLWTFPCGRRAVLQSIDRPYSCLTRQRLISTGSDCATLIKSAHIRDFKDNFELPTPIEIQLARAAIAHGAKVPHKWALIDGGEVGFGGCGSMRPYGFGRSAYFSACGRRSLQTVEMDLVMGGWVDGWGKMACGWMFAQTVF